MYNEKSFKNHIFWMKVKRVFLILVFAMAGALAGVMISDVVINVLFLNILYRTPIIVIATLLMISLALLLTAGTGAAVQDAYWKMALMRKVIVISKKLDNVSVVANEDLGEMMDSLNEIEMPQQHKKEKRLKNKPRTTPIK
ncbi:MAG: hypothetical protein J6J60_01740 [Clostridia bacterium]|nr:hypothetical protein [Clostridia bacterium]